MIAQIAASIVLSQGQDSEVTLRYKTLANGAVVGSETETYRKDGRVDFQYEYNDRGRGPKVAGHYLLAPDGKFLEAAMEGVDYFKAPVDENFEVVGGSAQWHSTTEKGQADAGAFYVSQNGSPAELAILARALIKAKGTIKLFPSGEAHLEKLTDLNVTQNGTSMHVTEYAVTGLYFSPALVWLDDDDRFFASPGSWRAILREGWESVNKKLYDIDDKAEDRRLAKLASSLSRGQTQKTAFRHVRVFDSEHARMLDDQTVTVVGKTISQVGPSTKIPVGKGFRIVDGKGKTLLPGLFDMHTHLGADDGILHMASGVTSVRDMGNDIPTLSRLEAQWKKGEQIGPRVFKAGLIDGRGPFQCPTGLYADTLKEALAEVNRYADLGYIQIKVYSSLDPKFLPEIIKVAHKRGLRVSGHVPNGIIASQFVEEGADELQHMNFVMLNFLADKVKDTRTPERFTAVGQYAVGIDLESDAVEGFIKDLLKHPTVIDATVATFESMLCARPGTCTPGLKAVLDRLPVQVRRGAFSGGLPVTQESGPTYQASFDNMLKMLKRLWDAGVPILAGTDDLAGLMLHRELELEARAGIPPVKCLQIATWNAARLLKQTTKLGSIAPGKSADLLLVRGDPSQNISDIRSGEFVMKEGRLYACASLYKAVGIAPSR